MSGDGAKRETATTNDERCRCILCLDESPTRWSRATCCGAPYCAVHDEGEDAVRNRRWAIQYGCPACRAKPAYELFVLAHDEISLMSKTRDDDDNEFRSIRVKLDARSARRVAASLRRDRGRNFERTIVEVVMAFLFAHRHSNASVGDFIERASTSVPTVRNATDVSGFKAFDVTSGDDADGTATTTNRVIVYSGFHFS